VIDSQPDSSPALHLPPASFEDGNSWTYHPQAVTVVGPALAMGMRVRVLASAEEVQRLSVGHGEWTPQVGV
jgi:hypothetical protein